MNSALINAEKRVNRALRIIRKRNKRMLRQLLNAHSAYYKYLGTFERDKEYFIARTPAYNAYKICVKQLNSVGHLINKGEFNDAASCLIGMVEEGPIVDPNGKQEAAWDRFSYMCDLVTEEHMASDDVTREAQQLLD